MPDPAVIDPPTPLHGELGRHYELIKKAIPSCLVKSSPERRKALKETPAVIPDWYRTASQAQKDQLNTYLEARCESLNELEKSFDNIQPLSAFAQPLLEAALKAAGHVLDVNQTWLRLYIPVEDSFGVKTGGFRVKTFSLLQAALCNFEAREARQGFFDSASGFISQPDALNHFERHPTSLSIHAYAQLCRELNLGNQYQLYLRPLLEQAVVRERYVRHQADAFKAAAYLALVKGDIGTSDHALLMQVATGAKHVLLDGSPIRYRGLRLMNLPIHDCLIIDPCPQLRHACWIIAYIPDDPDHPIKRYESLNEFRNDLTDRLTASASHKPDRSKAWTATQYQQFFARFVADKDRAYYYRRLTELVVDAPPQPFWAPLLGSEWGRILTSPSFSIESPFEEAQPSVRVSVTNPEFNIRTAEFSGLVMSSNLWVYRYASLRTRLLADAQNQAVTTADADEASHSRRAAHYLSILMFGLNLVAMAVPPLGAVLGVAMAGQLLYEVIEGVIELSEGDREAGWSHITDVVENLALLAAQAAAVHFIVSPVIEQMKAVRMPGGKTRLLQPDLSAYEHTSPVPEGVTADERGLHTHNGKTLLALEDKRYAVQKDPVTDEYRITHPTRPDAYQPKLTSNGSGLWNHELEQPQSWEGAILMRRLGPATERFSDAQLQQVRQVADVSEDVLRRIHVEGEPVPAVVLDTLRQFRAYGDAGRIAQGIRDNALPDALCSYPASLAVELPRWPAGKAIEAFVAQNLEGSSIKYGRADAVAADTLKVSRKDLMEGQLPRRIVEFLGESELLALVGRYTPSEPQARVEALRDQLESYAKGVKARLMRSLYEAQRPAIDGPVGLIRRDFPRLPELMVQELLAEVMPTQLQAMTASRRIPLDLAEKARGLQQQVRLIQAYEGLYLEAMAGPDTEALVLNTLPSLAGWSDNLRLEVREGGFEGKLRASYGPADATQRKVLVQVDAGRYETFDERGQQLHGIDDLYVALQHALPDAHRNAIGLPHVGQGDVLKSLLIEHAITRGQLASVLGMRPLRKPFFRLPQRISANRLGYPLSGRGQGASRLSIEERVQAIYRTMTPAQMVGYLRGRDLVRLQWLKDLETQAHDFDRVLSHWTDSGLEHSRAVYDVRHKISEALRQAWERRGDRDVDMGGYLRGQRISLRGSRVGAQLETLPPLPVNFDHVSSLELRRCGLTDASVDVLSIFPALRVLDLAGNNLTRLPQALERMRWLEGLDLADNHIVLTEQSALQVRGMRGLFTLSLEGNPLSRTVDISHMAVLRWLYLGGCELQEWPVGLFGRPRPRGFMLDLTGNRLTTIPDVAPGSDRALILARAVVTRDLLTPEVLCTLRGYIESVGMDPDRRFPVRGTQDSAHWRSGLSMEQWTSKNEVWNALEESYGSEGFFDELRKLSESGDMDVYQQDLTAKVWRMLEAMATDSELRDRLFDMASAPTRCVDAGAQLFNAMGVEVLVYEAQALHDSALMKLELLDLAKGKARLDELGRIAKARVEELLRQGRKFPEYDEHGDLIQRYDDTGRPIPSIDEVEIHLAYATRLADRLDLPWQSSRMKFKEPDVTPAMIDAAYTRVTALEQGDLLRDGILDQPFWVDYIESAHADEFTAVSARNDALINLYAAQQEWVDNGSLSEQKKAELRLTIDTSAQVLGKSPSQVSPGQVMSDEEYFSDVASLGEERKSILRSVTDREMGRIRVSSIAT